MPNHYKELPFRELTNANLIERGTVEICPLFQENSSLAILRLSPGAKIKKHRHMVDNETYILIETDDLGAEVKFSTLGDCMRGEEHDLENTTQEDWYVISIKWPAGV